MVDPLDAVTMTITPRTGKVLRLADKIARRHGRGCVGTEHLLLALIEEGDGIAGQVLAAVGAARPALERTEAILGSPSYRGASPSSGAPAPSPRPLRMTVPIPPGSR